MLRTALDTGLVRPLLAATALFPEGVETAPSGRSALAWILAGLLAVGALYFAIRLLELDRMNKETPNQEDPLRDESREAGSQAAALRHQGKT